MEKKLILDLVDMNDSGQGIAKKDGIVYFVNGGVIGDRIECEIQLVKKNYKVAKALHLIKPSEWRKTDFKDTLEMPYGLSLQALNYDKQLEFKEKNLYKTLDKIAGIEIEKRNPIIGLDGENRYRNKGVFPVRDDNGKIKIGAFERGSHTIIEVLDNVAMPESYALILSEIKKIAREFKISAYHELRHSGGLKFITIRSNPDGEHLIVLHFNEDELKNKKISDDFTEILVSELEKYNIKILGIVKAIQAKKSNFAGGGKLSLLYGKDYIYNRVGNAKFKLGVKSFFQVSTEGVEKLYGEVLRLASPIDFETVWDVYCGVGSIGLYLLSALKTMGLKEDNPPVSLKGLEYVEEAIDFAKENAEINGIEKTHFEAGKAEDLLPLWVKKYSTPDLIIVDPPRKGVDRKALEAIIETGVQHIIYVSCKPSTLARDLKILNEAGYKCVEVTPVDIFPMSMHCECVVRMEKK